MYHLCVVLGIVICVFQYSLVSGFRRGESYEASLHRSDVYSDLGQGVRDDFDTIAGKYALILLIFGFAFVLRQVFDGRIAMIVSLTAVFVAVIPLWDVLAMKRLAFRYSDSARFDLFRETFLVDILVVGLVLTVILIDAVSLIYLRNGDPAAANSEDLAGSKAKVDSGPRT